MNSNSLGIVKQIIADYGEEILGAPKRLKAFFFDLTKDESKPLRTTFGRCIEDAYTHSRQQRMPPCVSRKATIAQRVYEEHRLDTVLCGKVLDILEVALYGTASAASKAAPVPQVVSSIKSQVTYRLSVNMWESGHFSTE
ncbi:MAG: hypothetical protein LBB43_06705 [Spirochaetaceae bacterium]|jgi:hypothetical protein|nr:hypothetical protein [Spirochaetaceae bacterium]